MKTLEQIKDDYAMSIGYYDFDTLISSGHIVSIKQSVNELLILVQKECLNNTEKNVYNANSWGGTMDITDENNIIR